MTDTEDQAFQAGQIELAKKISAALKSFRGKNFKTYTPVFKMGFNQAEIIINRILNK